MKNILPIFLAFQVLVASSPDSQRMQILFKTSALFHHFVHHLTYHPEKIDVLDFVQLHYSDHAHHEEDHDQHKNLPFQHHHDQQNIPTQTPCLLPTFCTITPFPKLDIVYNSLIFHSQRRHSSSYLGDIWQPPKV